MSDRPKLPIKSLHRDEIPTILVQSGKVSTDLILDRKPSSTRSRADDPTVSNVASRLRSS